MLIPTVLEKNSKWQRAYDIYSRLLKEKNYILGEEINEHTSISLLHNFYF